MEKHRFSNLHTLSKLNQVFKENILFVFAVQAAQKNKQKKSFTIDLNHFEHPQEPTETIIAQPPLQQSRSPAKEKTNTKGIRKNRNFSLLLRILKRSKPTIAAKNLFETLWKKPQMNMNMSIGAQDGISDHKSQTK